MHRFNRKKYSNCKECPLRDEVCVKGLTEAPSEPKFVIVGDYPSDSEVVTKRPFTNYASKWLDGALRYGDIRRQSVHMTYAVCCKPPKSYGGSYELSEAVKCCKPGLEAELKWLKEDCGVRAISVVGGIAVGMLGIKFKLLQCRGSVYLYEGLPVVPTYAPEFIMRGKQKEMTTWICDFKKAYGFLYNKYKKPVENFNLFPTLKDVKDFYKKAVEKKAVLGVDIETTGLTPEHGDIIVCGFAIDHKTAIAIPRLKQGGQQYWDLKERPQVKKYIRKLLELPTIYQNGLFDVYFLEQKGYPVKNFYGDTMVMHHNIHPELPHGLDYITSIYGSTPYWKNTLKDRPGSILNLPDDELRTYNLRDCIVMKQMYPKLVEDLKELKTYDVYNKISKPLLRKLVDIRKRGMPFSQSRCTRWRKQLVTKIGDIEKDLFKKFKLPEGFNLSSGDHVRLLVFGEVGKQFTNAVNVIDKDYGKDSKLAKNTKKYKNLLACKNIYVNTVPLTIPTSYKKNKSGKSGNTSVDKTAFIALTIACRKRLEAISNKKRPGKTDAEEIIGLQNTLLFISLYLVRQKTEKLRSTYTSFPVGLDKKVHSSLKIGPSTGRLASARPNLQNLPKAGKKMFKAPEGYSIVDGDYSGLELWVLAYLSDDEVLINMIESGMNVHSENTKILYKIDEKDPTWEKRRRTAKTYIFGRNYGGGLPGIYRRIMLENSDLDLTYKEFCDIDDRYRAAHPKYFSWMENVKEQLLSTRTLRNAFGRIRIFLSDENSMLREGLNFPIQSTGADITNKALMKLNDVLEKKYGDEASIIMTVHDSIVLLVKNELLEEVCKLMKKIMTEKVKIGKYNVSPNVDITYGPDWYDQKDLEI